MHTIEGWQSTMMSPSWTSNSYHFTIRQDGRIVQHVSIYTPAWHAGMDHRIDPATGQPRDPKPTWWPLFRDANPNTHTIGISAEGSAVGADGLPYAWTEAQVQSTIRILKWIAEETGIKYETNRTFVRHSYLAPHRRKDPGERFPEDRVLAALVTSPTPPVVAPGVAIEVVIDGKRILTEPGSGGELVDGEYLYRRPIDLGVLGKGWVVVGVRLP